MAARNFVQSAFLEYIIPAWHYQVVETMRIAMLLSGGVDSSVALALARRAGHTITAFYLKIWLEDELSYLGSCPWEDDLAYARAVCERLSIPLEVVPLQRDYYERVVEYALAELRRGRTPSPDIFCNQRIKFGVFADHIGPEFEKIASGHYAVIEEGERGLVLRRSPDPVKDQTYFLSHLSQGQVARALFPIGALTKAQVRSRARELALPTSDRPDSQGICFLGKIRYPDFVRHYLGERQGSIVELESGRLLGIHRGYWFHTIGQRQGLGLGNGPWYVVHKDIEENIVYVSHRAGGFARARSELTVCEPHWISGSPFAEGPGLTADGGRSEAAAGSRTEAREGAFGRALRLDIKLRHGPELHSSTVEPLSGDRLRIIMDLPDDGIAPGQFAVFYRGDVCLGGARIAEEDPDEPSFRRSDDRSLRVDPAAARL